MRVSSRDWLRQFTEKRDSLLLEHDDASVAAIAAARAAPPHLARPQEALRERPKEAGPSYAVFRKSIPPKGGGNLAKECPLRSEKSVNPTRTVHAKARALGLDDDQREIMESVTGKGSCSEMGAIRLNVVLMKLDKLRPSDAVAVLEARRRTLSEPGPEGVHALSTTALNPLIASRGERVRTLQDTQVTA